MARTKLSFNASISDSFVLLQSTSKAQRQDEAIRQARALLVRRLQACTGFSNQREQSHLLCVRPADSKAALKNSSKSSLAQASIAEAGILVDDCILWCNRTSVGVRRQGCLAERSSDISVTGLHRTATNGLVEASVACLLRHGTCTWCAQPTADLEFASSWTVYRIQILECATNT